MSPAGTTKAVFFDVDFTLIYPGPTFQGEGYARFCAQHGITIDPARFNEAVRIASSILNDAQEHIYNDDIFIRYTGRIIEEMGWSIERGNSEETTVRSALPLKGDVGIDKG